MNPTRNPNNALEGRARFDIVSLLDKPDGNVGVELGVAAGAFAAGMVHSRRFKRFFGVDAYADHHDVEEYKAALRRVGLFADYTLLRMTFEEALDLFADNSLDFVYIDGYAHAGQDGGETIYAWSAKVRNGGVVSGHDYAPCFPLVVEAVDRLVADGGFQLHVTTEADDGGSYPSWAVVKNSPLPHHAPADLIRRGRRAAKAFMRRNAAKRLVKSFMASASWPSGAVKGKGKVR